MRQVESLTFIPRVVERSDLSSRRHCTLRIWHGVSFEGGEKSPIRKKRTHPLAIE